MDNDRQSYHLTLGKGCGRCCRSCQEEVDPGRSEDLNKGFKIPGLFRTTSGSKNDPYPALVPERDTSPSLQRC